MKPRTGIELVDRAIALISEVGLSTLFPYYFGAMPWAIGVLFFFSDMVYNARANEHSSEYALGLSLLYLWKNCWQAVYTNNLYDCLTGEQRSWSRPRIIRLVLVTCAVQPLALVALPVAMLITLPYAQVLAFFKNMQLLAGMDEVLPAKEAWRLAVTWTRQNWMGLAVVTLGALLAFVNVFVLLAGLPQIAKSALGMESDLSRLGVRILSPLLLLAAVLVVYLIFDPLLDAFYAIRCFHGRAVTTGQDLRIVLRRLAASLTLVAILVGSHLANAQLAIAQQPPSHDQLEKSIEKVLERDEFAWRTPKANYSPAWVASIEKVWRKFTGFIKKFLEWLLANNPERDQGRSGDIPNRSTLQLLLYVSAGIFALVLGGILYWQWSQRKTPVQVAKAMPNITKVDLKDEAITADQLPEAEWLALASTQAAKGEYRLATRALYLAGLNHLMHRDLVSVKQWKSGLEYVRELDRRAKMTPQLSPAFAGCLQTFEKGWYGFEVVDGATYQQMLGQLEALRSLNA